MDDKPTEAMKLAEVYIKEEPNEEQSNWMEIREDLCEQTMVESKEELCEQTMVIKDEPGEKSINWVEVKEDESGQTRNWSKDESFDHNTYSNVGVDPLMQYSMENAMDAATSAGLGKSKTKAQKMSKKRTYKESFLNFGFSFIVNKGVEMPQCVICSKTLANESLKPVKLKEHLLKVHPEKATKDLAYFKYKEHELKRSRSDHGTEILFQHTNVAEASYRISLLIAKQKKAHTIGETLIKPCMIEAAHLVLDQKCVYKLDQISLSENTIKECIDEMSQDIKFQVMEKIRLSPFFAIQLDETTDIAQLPQLLVYARFISNNEVEEELLFCSPLATTTTTKAEDVMNIVSNFFEEGNLSWDNLVGVCTDGASRLFGSKSGFMTLVRMKNPDVITTHCLVHREAIASKTLPAALKLTLEIVIRIVNYIKGEALNTTLFRKLCQDMDSAYQDLLLYTSARWLSRGNILARVFELLDELQNFLSAQGRKAVHLLQDIQGPFKCNLAYLADVFEALNGLNRQLQGPDTTIIMHTDAIKAFLDKLGLWKRKVERGNVSSFHRLNEVLGDKPLANDLQQEIKEHLIALQEEFRRYFHDPDGMETVQLTLARNPFKCSVDDLPDDIQEDFLEFINNTAAKEHFQEQQQYSTSNCWANMLSAFPKTSQFALQVLIPFCSTYLCESGFSTLLEIKSKAEHGLNAETDMRCALSHTDPRIDLLIAIKQAHPSQLITLLN